MGALVSGSFSFVDARSGVTTRLGVVLTNATVLRRKNIFIACDTLLYAVVLPCNFLSQAPISGSLAVWICFPIPVLSPLSTAGVPMSDQPDRILRIRTVLDRTGLTRSTLYRKMEAGTFPRQIPISIRCVGWSEAAVGEWLANPYFFEVANDTGGTGGGLRHGKR
jgi:prophage regulatory protein